MHAANDRPNARCPEVIYAKQIDCFVVSPQCTQLSLVGDVRWIVGTGWKRNWNPIPPDLICGRFTVKQGTCRPPHPLAPSPHQSSSIEAGSGSSFVPHVLSQATGMTASTRKRADPPSFPLPGLRARCPASSPDPAPKQQPSCLQENRDKP